jgi:hypothetical protein
LNVHPSRRFSFDSPASYQICVEGMVDPEWSDRLGGMAITAEIVTDGSNLSTLSGELSDQAALNGVLSTLYEWHLPVVSVSRIKASKKDKGKGG